MSGCFQQVRRGFVLARRAAAALRAGHTTNATTKITTIKPSDSHSGNLEMHDADAVQILDAAA